MVCVYIDTGYLTGLNNVAMLGLASAAPAGDSTSTPDASGPLFGPDGPVCGDIRQSDFLSCGNREFC